MQKLKIGSIIISLVILMPVAAPVAEALNPGFRVQEGEDPDRIENEIKTQLILLKEEKRRLAEYALRNPYLRSVESRRFDPEKLANVITYKDAPFPISEIMPKFSPAPGKDSISTCAKIVDRLILGIIILLALAGVVFILAGRSSSP